MTDKFTRYAELKAGAKFIEEEMKRLSLEIAEELLTRNLTEYSNEKGKFTLQNKKSWTYPTDVVNLEAKLKGLKKETELNGTAKAEITQYLIFKGV